MIELSPVDARDLSLIVNIIKEHHSYASGAMNRVIDLVDRLRTELALSRDTTPPAPPLWRPPQDAPEDTPVLCYAAHLAPNERFFVNSMIWYEQHDWDLVEDTETRRVEERKTTRTQAWGNYNVPDFWTTLPEVPKGYGKEVTAWIGAPEFTDPRTGRTFRWSGAAWVEKEQTA